tara:strand:+ start:176 stop:322 length:147 start_codon:yes stop_codon:yes gene_type:complete
MDINLILLIPNAMVLGYQYFEEDEQFKYSELNVFLFFVQIQFRWGENL